MTARIPLHTRDGSVRAWAIVDEADRPLVEAFRWHLKKGYACAYAGGGRAHRRAVSMHRIVMGLGRDDPQEVDHRNLNKLDNRRANLRLATRQQNGQNLPPRRQGTSAHRGVSFHKKSRKWRAYIRVDYKQRHLGHFDSEDEAAEVARRAREELMPFAEG